MCLVANVRVCLVARSIPSFPSRFRATPPNPSCPPLPRIISGSTPEPVVSSASRHRWVTAPEGGTPRLPRRRARSGDERPSGGCERWNRSKGGGWRGGCWDGGVVRGARLVQGRGASVRLVLIADEILGVLLAPHEREGAERRVGHHGGVGVRGREPEQSSKEIAGGSARSLADVGEQRRADLRGQAGRARALGHATTRKCRASRNFGSGERSGVDLGARERLRGPKGVRQSRCRDERLETPRAGIARASSGSRACRDERGSGADSAKKIHFSIHFSPEGETCSLRFPPRRPTPRHHPSSRAR